MSQSADNVIDHAALFLEPQYDSMIKAKRQNFENATPQAEIDRIREWTKTVEYQDKNFAREALCINPAKACQPLGAVFAGYVFVEKFVGEGQKEFWKPPGPES